MKSTALFVLLGLSVLLGTCSGHGNIHQSRSHLCHPTTGPKNKECGAAMWDPHSIEGFKGFPNAGPRDGYIASGDVPQFHELDAAGVDRWWHVPISNYVVGEKDGKLVLDFPWTLTAPHPTLTFRYFITKKSFNPAAVLTREQLDLTPFCTDNFQGATPPRDYVSRNCMLDATGYSGYHVILGVWDIADTPNAFYQAIDIDFSAASKNE